MKRDSDLIIEAIYQARRTPGRFTARDRAIIAACATYWHPAGWADWSEVAAAAGVSKARARRYAAVGASILLRERREIVAWARGCDVARRQRTVCILARGVLRRSHTIGDFHLANAGLQLAKMGLEAA